MEYTIRCGRSLSEIKLAHQLVEKIYRQYGLIDHKLPFVHSPYMMVFNDNARLVGTMTVQTPEKQLNCERILEIDLRDYLPKGYTRNRILEVGRLGLDSNQSPAEKWLTWYGIQYGTCAFQEIGGYQGYVCIISPIVEQMVRKLGCELIPIELKLESRVHDKLEQLSPVYFDRNKFPMLHLIDCSKMKAALDSNPALLSNITIAMDSLAARPAVRQRR